MNYDKIGQNFDKIAKKYDKISSLQRDIASFLHEVYLENRDTQKEYKNICEIGSGTGFLTEKIAPIFSKSKISCLDISQESLEIAKSKNLGKNIEFICENILNCNLENFDIFFASMSLHWMSEKLPNFLNKIDKSGKDFCFAIPLFESLDEVREKINEFTELDGVLVFPKKEEILQNLKCNFVEKKFYKAMAFSDIIKLLSQYKIENFSKKNTVAITKKMLLCEDIVNFSYTVLFVYKI